MKAQNILETIGNTPHLKSTGSLAINMIFGLSWKELTPGQASKIELLFL